MGPAGVCVACGGDGSRLAAEQVYCARCRWLRPLAASYDLGLEAFLWPADAEVMARLQSIQPLSAAARKVSEGLGRPWLEAAVNGVRLSEDQLPDVFALAVRAARILGLTHLPEIYVSGQNLWDTMTFGSETDAFVSLGSVLANLRGKDLLFVVAREMGHVRAGHALWRTVTELVRGRRDAGSILGGGVMEFLNPAKLIQSSVQAPLMAWKRNSELTADRAGLLVVGDMEVAERVLMQWALKSFPLYRRISQSAWRRQEDESDDATMRVSEWMMTANPYIARRLKLLRAFAASADFAAWREVVAYWTRDLPDFELPATSTEPGAQQPRRAGDMVRIICVVCKQPMRVPRAALQGRSVVKIRCANPQCRKVMAVKARRPPAPGPETLTPGD
ncbi:MAG: M48 family peptidase [Deltaproteobacteria bacterium]|nr:MAG: M48 family peptidase [Deltaproteobacteria bacterium]